MRGRAGREPPLCVGARGCGWSWLGVKEGREPRLQILRGGASSEKRGEGVG